MKVDGSWMVTYFPVAHFSYDIQHMIRIQTMIGENRQLVTDEPDEFEK